MTALLVSVDKAVREKSRHPTDRCRATCGLLDGRSHDMRDGRAHHLCVKPLFHEGAHQFIETCLRDRGVAASKARRAARRRPLRALLKEKAEEAESEATEGNDGLLAEWPRDYVCPHGCHLDSEGCPACVADDSADGREG